MHPSRMTFRMSKEQPESRKKRLGACPSPARVGSSSSSQSDVPIPCNFETWIASDFFFNLPDRTRASSWDESEEEESPATENVSLSRRIYSAGSKKSQESVSSEIDELKKEFFRSLEESREDDKKLRYDVVDRRQSPARIRRRTKSSSSSSPVPETMNHSIEDKNFPDETENKMLELDSKIFLNNFFTELRSRRISLFDSGVVEDIAQKSSDPNDDGYCRTSRKLSQILEVEEARRDLDRNLDESNKEKNRMSKEPQEEQVRFPEYKSLSLEKLEGGSKTLRGSLSERCDGLFRQANEDGIHLMAKTAKTQLGSPNETFLEPLKLDREESAETLEQIKIKHSPKFRISVGKESERSLVMEDINTSDRKTQSEVKTSSSEESSCGKSYSSRETQEVLLESPSLNSSSRTLKLDPLEIPHSTPLSGGTNKTTQGSRSLRSVKENRHSSESSTSRTSISRRITGSPKSTPTPRSTSSEENQELEKYSGRREEEKKSSHRRSFRSHASERKSSNKSVSSAINSPTSVEKENLLDTVESKSERTIEEVEEPEREGNESNRSKTSGSSGRDGGKRLSIINEASFEDVEIMNVHLENEQSSDVLGRTEEETKENCRKNGGMWDDLIEAFDGSQSSSFSRQENFPGFPPRTEKSPLSSSRNSAFPFEKDSEKSDEEAFEEDSFMHSRRLAEMGKKSPGRSSGKRLQKKQEDLLKDVKDPYLVVEELPEENPRTKEERPVQHSSTFFFDVTKGTPFGIGEFGDVTCWNVGKSDMVESEKPEDHGDGLKMSHSRWDPFAFAQEKKEGSKTHRRPSTELRRDSEEEEIIFIPNSIKPSKSDNCIVITSEKERSEVSRKRKRESSSMSKSTIQEHSDSESTEEAENLGLNREIVRRLSSSVSNINSLLEKDEDVRESRRDLFQKQKEEVESAKRQEKKDKMASKGHNWLILKNPEGKQTKKQKKKSKSRKTPSREYLYQDLSQASVPGLKLRNTNCLQTLYKRVISVFCLTSSSSAATSN